MRDIVPVFAACAVPVHSWSILLFFNQMPGWRVYLSTWDLIGTFAYTQTFALVESLSILAITILIAVVLPARFLRAKFSSKASLLVLSILAWVVAAHLTGIKPWESSRPWEPWIYWVEGIAFLASVGGSLWLLERHRRVEWAVGAFVDRVTVLLYLHVPIALLSVLIVVLRNVAGVFR
jgi:hypothetical protein